jgi:hypothetical protein
VWHDINAGYKAQKISFSGQHGHQKYSGSVLDILLFSDETITLILQKTINIQKNSYKATL